MILLPCGILKNREFCTFEKMSTFQSKFVTNTDRIGKGEKRYSKIIHYPPGGGFFDWHTHPRFPTNYGLILNLSKKGISRFRGVTKKTPFFLRKVFSLMNKAKDQYSVETKVLG